LAAVAFVPLTASNGKPDVGAFDRWMRYFFPAIAEKAITGEASALRAAVRVG